MCLFCTTYTSRRKSHINVYLLYYSSWFMCAFSVCMHALHMSLRREFVEIYIYVLMLRFCLFVFQPTSVRTTLQRTNYPRSPSNRPQSSSHHYRVTTTIRARTHTTKHLINRSLRSPKKAPPTNTEERKTTKTKLVAWSLSKVIPGSSSAHRNRSIR